MSKIKHIVKIGQKFGKLTVLEKIREDLRGRSFKVICDCGTQKELKASVFVSGNTRSCGCLFKETHKKRRFPDEEAVAREVFNQYKMRCKRDSIELTIDLDYFKQVIYKNCYYCDLPPSNRKMTWGRLGGLYSGIDRINSDIGYIKGNCVPCCKSCNIAKNTMSQKEFLDWVGRVYKFSIKTQICLDSNQK